MSTSNRSKVVNAPSNLISKSENDSLFRILGQGCSTLASGVVQLFLSDATDNTGSWRKRCCGVACFVKDIAKRSYFIRVFDIKKQQLLWEQELYTQFRYKIPREFFHTFEADNYQAGLNFASEDEAGIFKTAVETKLHERRERKLQRQTQKKRNVAGSGARQAPSPGATPLAARPTGAPPAAAPVTVDLTQRARKNSTNTKKDKNKKGQTKMTKADISTPTDFRHLSHVGWDPDKGFDMDNLQPDMQMLFNSVGITPDDDVDKETIDFIYDFVGRNGGIEAVRKEMADRPAPPPPPSLPAPPPPARPTPSIPSQPPPSLRPSAPSPPTSRRPGPPPPMRNSPKGQAPPPPGRPGPPARPTASRPSPPMGPPPHPSKSSGGGPPPPPAPPAPPAPPPPPPPGMSAVSHSPVVASPSSDGGGGSEGRGGLLKDLLKGGSHLKKVDPKSQSEKPSSEDDDGIVGALRSALVERQKHIQGNYDDNEDSDEIDDDEWDDL